jgi:CDP-glucose 4,6-dehydratase
MMNCAHLKPDIRNTAKGEIHSQYLDANKAQASLHWQPQFSLEAGLKETIAWYTNYFTHIGLPRNRAVDHD